MSNTVNRGSAPNDQTADTLYDAFGKVNVKFDQQDDLKQVQDATEKALPVDADSLPLIDSAAAVETPKLKWLSWANIKVTLKAYFDTLYNNLGLGETQTTAYRGDRGKTGYDHSQTAHAPSNATANDTDANLKARSNHTGSQLASTISDFAATVRSTVLTGLSLTTNAAISATDTVLSALGKLQKQITDHFSSHPAPTNRDTRNEAANANIQTHVTSAHAPSNATVNDTDANLKARSNHTGTQLASTISNFAATVRSTVLTGLSLTTNAAIAATDTVLSALGKLQKQITDHFSSHPAPTNRDTRNEAANANIQTHVTSDHAPSNATANDTDANLKARGNHTGTQLASTISDFAATVRSTVLTGLSLTTNAAISATDTVLSALGKLQKQITDHFSSHPAPTNRDTRNEPANANIQSHVSSAHAPSNAQINSDITKAEIEAKLTDLISSHGHNLLSGSYNWGGGILWFDINKTNGHLVRYSNSTDYSFEVGSDDLPTNSVLFFIQTGVGKLSITSSGSITVGETASSNGPQTGFMLRKNSETHWDSFPFGGSGGEITGLTTNKIPKAESDTSINDSNLEQVPGSNNLIRVGPGEVVSTSPDVNSFLVTGNLFVGDGADIDGTGAQSGNFKGAIRIGDGVGMWAGTIKYISNIQDFQAYQGSAWKSIINGNITKAEIEAVLTGAISSHTHNYEPVISSKGSAFNKNFGTTSGTVTQGNDSRLPATNEKGALAGMGHPHSASKYVNGTYGTAAPSGGLDGDVYFQYE